MADEQPDPPDPQLAGLTLLFAPGLLTGLLPDLALSDVWPVLHARFGMRVIAAYSHPMRGCQANAADLAAALSQGVGHDETGRLRRPGEATPPEGDVLVVAYSKGGPDTLAPPADRPDLAGRRNLARSSDGHQPFSDRRSPTGCSPCSSATPGRSDRAQRALAAFGPALIGGNGLGSTVGSTSTTRRGQSGTSPARSEHSGGLRIAPRSLPPRSRSSRWPPTPAFPRTRRRSGPRAGSDLQLRIPDTRLDLPSFVPLASLHTDHWDIAYPNRDPGGRTTHRSSSVFQPFPRAAAMAALIRTLAEVGLLSSHEVGPWVTTPEPACN